MSRRDRFKLSKRLSCIEKMLEAPAACRVPYRLCDVGCDHVHVPIFLAERGIITSALCMDVIPGPLMKARDNLERYGQQDKITLRLSDGLDEYSENEADVLLISGLGGRLISTILEREPEKTLSFREMLLQPQSDAYLVRKTASELGFSIVDEAMVSEDGKFYPVIRFAGSEFPITAPGMTGVSAGDTVYTDAELRYGPVLIGKKDPVLKRYLENGLRKLETVLAGWPENSDPDKKKEMEEEALTIRQTLALFGEGRPL